MNPIMSRRRMLGAMLATGLGPAATRLAHGVATTGGTASGWASGGTAAMVDKPSYPNPFSTVGSAPCVLVPASTAGPCTTETDLLREDISEGWPGLPLRLALRVVDTTCNPLAGATVKIWHTNREGSYSGETPFNGFCLLQQSYAASDFFRGVRTTDDEGIVYFDTCYPGWYPGRAIHIHFQVSEGARTFRVSQVYFPEEITTDIFAEHPDYSPYGQPDTVFDTDGILRQLPVDEREAVVLDVAQMSDGAMLASKTLTVLGTVSQPTPTRPPASATPTPTIAGPVPCVGDCNADDSVGIDELVRGVNLALGRPDARPCDSLDADHDGKVSVSELVRAVNAALRGCKT